MFTQHRGPERVWVAESDVDYFIKLYARGGSPAARWSDYRKGGFFFTDDEWGVSLRPNPQRPRVHSPE